MTKLLETPPVLLSSTFDKDAALAAVLYLVEKLGQPSRQTIFHLLYLADKKHLEDYGRFISTDTYYALTQGPVPGHIYDVLNSLGRQGEYLSLDKEFKQVFAASIHMTEDNCLKVATLANLENLSESDIKCLKGVLETYGKLSSQELEQLCQDVAWKATPRNQEMSLGVIVQTLASSENLLEYLRDPFPGDL